MPPHLQGHLDCEKFPINKVIIPLSGIKVMGQESARMQLFVLGRTLGQNGPHSNVQVVDPHHELTGRVRMDEAGGSDETMLKIQKTPCWQLRGEKPGCCRPY